MKTLEEPPDDVTIILLGRTREAVLPTIVSRCQVVPFRHIPASEASGILAQNTGCTLPEAAIAIQAVGGSITKAAQFLRSKERGVFRTKIIGAMGSLLRADDLDILEYARDLVLASKTPLDEVRREQERDLEEKAEFLQASALKQLEARQKARHERGVHGIVAPNVLDSSRMASRRGSMLCRRRFSRRQRRCGCVYSRRRCPHHARARYARTGVCGRLRRCHFV